MKKSFWIPAIVFYVVNVIFCDSVQVGTVLFTTTDLVRKCWTECDKSLLRARYIMQDVLPDPDCIDFSNPEAVAILLDYFHACFQIISTSTYGKLQNLMYLALSDALGGYMRAYVLPFTRKAYYAGQMKYSEAKRLFQLYDELKMFLKTNGAGWTEPQKPDFKNIHVNPLAITGGGLQACKLLFIIEKHGKLPCESHNPNTEEVDSYNRERVKKWQENSKEISYENTKPSKHFNSSNFPNYSWNSARVNGKEDGTKKLHSLNYETSSNGQKFLKNFFKLMSMNTSEELQKDQGTSEKRKSEKRCFCGCPRCNGPSYSNKKVVVPLPILDDSTSPNSIALPFRKQPLRNLKARSSAFVLEHYYIAVIKCFISKGISRADIRNFNSKFYSWLVTQVHVTVEFFKVYPHLSEEQWYPAFGGVLRIMETIRRFGTNSSPRNLPSRDIGYLFDSGVEFEIEKSKRRDKTRNVDILEEECTYTKRHVFIAVLLVSLIWIFVFCTCIFYFQAGRGRNVFYQEYSETSSRSRNKDQKKKERFVNFQFLIRFFKNKNESNCTVNEQQVFYSIPKTRPNVPRREKKIEPKLWPSDDQLRKMKQPENERLLSYGHGDFPALDIPVMEKHFKSGISAWPCQPCLVPHGKTELFKTKKMSVEDLSMPKETRHRIEMLWKKPSIKLKRNVPKEGRERKSPKKKHVLTASKTTMSENIFRKNSSNTYSASAEDETKSTEKASSSCCCSSESCQHSHSSTSNTSSNSQEQQPPHLHKSKPLPQLPLNLLRLKRS